MEYQNLVQYPNLYPSIDNYGRTADGTFALVGNYETDNIIKYSVPELNEIQPVENTTFRFVLGVRESTAIDEIQYFTSEPFYDDLLASISENNPYFINNALNPNLFININLDSQKRIFNDLKLIDLGTGVRENQNIFLLNDNSVDYVTLVQYIDWVVSKSNPLDDETNGVLPAEKISDYEIGEYDPNTGEFTSNAAKAVALANRLEVLQNELAEVEEAIATITGDMPAEPQKRKTSVLEIVSLGLGAVSVLQGVKAAAGAIKAVKAVKAAESALKLAPISTVRNIPTSQQLNENLGNALRQKISSGAIDEHLKRVGASLQTTGGATIAAGTTAAVAQKAKKVSDVIKGIGRTTKTVVGKAGKVVGQAGAFAGKVTLQGSKLINKALQTPIGQAVSTTAQDAAGQVAAGVDKTKAIIGAVAKSVAIEVGKKVVTAVAKKVAGAAVGKIIGAATGPIGAGIMAAIGIVKFFVGKAKAKKEYNKQKAEYDRITSELERLTKRREDIEFEIQNILKSGKLTLEGKPKGDDMFSATQKYFQNIGRNILERQQQATLQPAVETITEPITRNTRQFGRLGNLGGR